MTGSAGATELDRAYRLCERIARSHYENFPVASRLLPAPMRPAIAAIYAFARRADDFADEPGPAPDERLRLLDGWRARLRAAAATAPASAPPTTAAIDVETDDDLIFVALGDAMRRHSLPVALFEDLLSAFRQDVSTTRYSTWEDLLDYSRRSAEPVGRLVLRVAGYDDPARDARSDAICSALQLANFWQDFGLDWKRGRLYLPQSAVARAAADERDLRAGRWTPAWRAALQEAIDRTRELFVRGRPLCDAVSGRLRWELRFTWLGGSSILDKVESSPDVLNRRPRLTLRDLPALALRASAWR